jgi:hypothetical protein
MPNRHEGLEGDLEETARMFSVLISGLDKCKT